MKKYEYRLISSESGFFRGLDYKEITNRMNELGTQSWEVITTTALTLGGQTTGFVITLKRELPG